MEAFALRQGMAGEIGYEIQAPVEYHKEVYDAIVEAGKEFGIRKLGARTVFVNHLESCFPTIITDYLPAIFDDDMQEYFVEFKATMPASMQTFSIAGSFDGTDVTEWYRSPIELGWAKVVKFDHDFIGRKALEAEVANPKRIMRTLVWNAEDIVDVYASLFQTGRTLSFYGISTRPARLHVRRQGVKKRQIGWSNNFTRL